MWRKKPFFDSAPHIIIFCENFGTFLTGWGRRLDDQTLIVFLCNWKVDSSVRNTFSKNSGTLNWVQKSLLFCSWIFVMFGIFFGNFFYYSRGLESSRIRSSTGHDIGLRFKPVFDFLRGECWVFESKLRNGFFRISRKNAWSATSFVSFKLSFFS